MANQCQRCGHVAAADGHATYGETLDCIEAFAFAEQLAKWARHWSEKPAGDRRDVRPERVVKRNRCLPIDLGL